MDYRQEMRNFVIGISKYAKAANRNFAVIPQNGIELISSNEQANGPLVQAYLSAIDGVGQEDLFFGYDDDNVATLPATVNYLKSYLNRIKSTKKVCPKVNKDPSRIQLRPGSSRSFHLNCVEVEGKRVKIEDE